MSRPTFNPMGSSMSFPMPNYDNYFDGLSNTPKRDNLNHNSILPIDPKELHKLKTKNDYSNLVKKTNLLLPINHYTDKAHSTVNQEPHHTINIKKPTIQNIDIHHQKHISKPAVIPKNTNTKESMIHSNAMRLEQGLGPLPISYYFPATKKINMNIDLPKIPKIKKAIAVSDAVSKEIALASKNPTPNITEGDRGSLSNPGYSMY